MATNDDLRLVLAHFHLRAARKFSLHEIAHRPAIRVRFLKVAREILGKEQATEIIERMVALVRVRHRARFGTPSPGTSTTRLPKHR